MRIDEEQVQFRVNGQPASAAQGASVAAALLANGVTHFRRSVSGQPRAPLCGMGVCFECRVMIDGRMHSKSCQVVIAPGMDVRTDA